MLFGIQIVGVLFALFMLYITFLHKKRDEFTLNESGFWTIIWLAFIFLVLFPHSFDFIIKDVLDFARTMDFFIVVGFMFVIGAIFYTYTVLRKTQKKVDTIVRKVAIDNVHKKKEE
jgi:hypothetical protein